MLMKGSYLSLTRQGGRRRIHALKRRLKMGGELIVVPKIGLPVEQVEKGEVPAIVEAAGAARF
jgi:hypothetical protein